MARPKGIAPWEPSPASAALLKQVNLVLDEYRDHLPLTVRQVFYRLVGEYHFDKTERSYKNLANMLVRARRALLIPFDSIRDDGTRVEQAGGYESVKDFWDVVRYSGKTFKRQRQSGQPVFVEVSCEAGGMVPQMVRVAHPFGVPVYSGGGFNSLTAIKEVADRALERDVPTVLLHIGDFDPSGVAIFNSLTEDAALFVSQITDPLRDPDHYEDGFAEKLHERICPKVEVRAEAALRAVRVALTADQVDEYSLDTAPPKGSDTRSAAWPYDYTAQAEALPPDILADLVREAIEAQFDLSVYAEVVATEQADRESILERIDGAG